MSAWSPDTGPWAQSGRPSPENRGLSEPVRSPCTKRDRAEGSDKAPKCTQEVTDRSGYEHQEADLQTKKQLLPCSPKEVVWAAGQASGLQLNKPGQDGKVTVTARWKRKVGPWVGSLGELSEGQRNESFLSLLVPVDWPYRRPSTLCGAPG